MPTLLRKHGFRFYFFSDEYQFKPPHIHVDKGEGTAIFWLNHVLLQKSKGMSSKDLIKAREIVIENQKIFLRKYNEYHKRNV